MKIKVLTRNPESYVRETKRDIARVPRNHAPEVHPFQEAREYTRALNATKLERMFAKPFLGSLDGHKDGVQVFTMVFSTLAPLRLVRTTVFLCFCSCIFCYFG